MTMRLQVKFKATTDKDTVVQPDASFLFQPCAAAAIFSATSSRSTPTNSLRWTRGLIPTGELRAGGGHAV